MVNIVMYEVLEGMACYANLLLASAVLRGLQSFVEAFFVVANFKILFLPIWLSVVTPSFLWEGWGERDMNLVN